MTSTTFCTLTCTPSNSAPAAELGSCLAQAGWMTSTSSRTNAGNVLCLAVVNLCLLRLVCVRYTYGLLPPRVSDCWLKAEDAILCFSDTIVKLRFAFGRVRANNILAYSARLTPRPVTKPPKKENSEAEIENDAISSSSSSRKPPKTFCVSFVCLDAFQVRKWKKKKKKTAASGFANRTHEPTQKALKRN